MIRIATMADLDAATEIYQHFHAQPLEKRSSVGWQPDVYPTRATAEAALERGDFFVCEEEGRLVASAVINRLQVDVYASAPWTIPAGDDEVMVLHTLVVDPCCAQRGIGRQFVAFYEDYARRQGCTALRMDTNARNTVARSFYRKLGFREIGIVPCRFNGIDGVDLVLLEKAL